MDTDGQTDGLGGGIGRVWCNDVWFGFTEVAQEHKQMLGPNCLLVPLHGGYLAELLRLAPLWDHTGSVVAAALLLPVISFYNEFAEEF